jgi:hypothetical protein
MGQVIAFQADAERRYAIAESVPVAELRVTPT